MNRLPTMLTLTDTRCPYTPLFRSMAGVPDDLAHPLARQQRPAAQLMSVAPGQGLVAFDAQGEIEPALAERWIVEDEGKSYIFRLRKATWPDGEEITAEQVARIQIGRAHV